MFPKEEEEKLVARVEASFENKVSSMDLMLHVKFEVN